MTISEPQMQVTYTVESRILTLFARHAALRRASASETLVSIRASKPPDCMRTHNVLTRAPFLSSILAHVSTRLPIPLGCYCEPSSRALRCLCRCLDLLNLGYQAMVFASSHHPLPRQPGSSADVGPFINVVTWVLLITSALAVLTRLITKRALRRSLDIDDAFVLLALVRHC
jgi:hypothetical protein